MRHQDSTSPTNEPSLPSHAEFKHALIQLPPHVLVMTNFSLALSDICLAIQIGAKLGISLATASEQADLEIAANYVSLIGKINRGEEVDRPERQKAALVYARLEPTIMKIRTVIESNREIFTDSALAEFNECSIEHGCMGPAAVKILQNPLNLEQIEKIACAVTKQLIASD